MPKLADPNIADPNVGPEPIPDPMKEARAEVRRLRERWAFGDELAGAEADRLELRVKAADEAAKKTPAELDAAIEAKLAEQAAKVAAATKVTEEETDDGNR